MKSCMIVTLLGCAFALATTASRAGAQAAQQDAIYGCTTCHADLRASLTEGVHGAHGLTCTSCHGGDPQAVELPDAHRGAFKPLNDKVAAAQSCGSCHGDPNRMRQFGLSSGQLAEFRTSRHGQLLFGRSDQNAPTCTNCHGTHVIYPPLDGRSSVYPTNIPKTCATCHSDQRLMARYRLPIDQIDEFRKGRHGVALFQDLNFAAPTCVSCHGAHSALPPGVTEIANVCSRCHESVGLAMASGPHGKAARSGKLSGCLGCHSNHGTQDVAADSLAATCVKCHEDDSRTRGTGVEIQKILVRATDDLASAERAIDHLRRQGLRTGDHQFRYQSAVSYYQQMAQVQHGLDVERMDELGRRLRSISVQLGGAAEVGAERRWEHRLLLLPVWFLTLSALALVGLVLRARRDGDGEADT